MILIAIAAIITTIAVGIFDTTGRIGTGSRAVLIARTTRSLVPDSDYSITFNLTSASSSPGAANEPFIFLNGSLAIHQRNRTFHAIRRFDRVDSFEFETWLIESRLCSSLQSSLHRSA